MYIVILNILLFLNLIVQTVSGNTYFRKFNSIRKLNSSVEVNDRVKCIMNKNNSCVCPGTCMEINNTEDYCLLENCWNWDTENLKCAESGPDYKSTLTLQAIPFTGIFGAGFGNMGRWDLFGIGSIIWGVGTIIPCILLCVYIVSYIQINPVTVFRLYCGIFILVILVYWIWGIIQIVNKNVLGPNGCPFVVD